MYYQGMLKNSTYEPYWQPGKFMLISSVCHIMLVLSRLTKSSDFFVKTEFFKSSGFTVILVTAPPACFWILDY